ncbi:MAG: hypothetical protein ACE5OZ_13370 [Candidatus Heimdallarchaeota archaeon]
MAASVTDLQNRMQELLYQLSTSRPQSHSERVLKDALNNMTRRALDPRLDKAKVSEELVSSLMNILLLAAELGLDIEAKIEQVLTELENRARGSSAS